jgi:hypothetical protein
MDLVPDVPGADRRDEANPEEIFAIGPAPQAQSQTPRPDCSLRENDCIRWQCICIADHCVRAELYFVNDN